MMLGNGETMLTRLTKWLSSKGFCSSQEFRQFSDEAFLKRLYFFILERQSTRMHVHKGGEEQRGREGGEKNFKPRQWRASIP